MKIIPFCPSLWNIFIKMHSFYVCQYVTVLQGRSIPSFIEHCTHSCTGHDEYLYNSVSSATRATMKGGGGKSFKCFDFRGADQLRRCTASKTPRYQVGSPRTQHLKRQNKNVLLAYAMVDIQVKRCDLEWERRPFQESLPQFCPTAEMFCMKNFSSDPFTKCTKCTSVWYKDFFLFHSFLNASIKDRGENTLNNMN